MSVNSEICKARSMFITRGVLNRKIVPDAIVYSWIRSELHNISFELLNQKNIANPIDILSLDISSSTTIKYMRTFNSDESIIYVINEDGNVIYRNEKKYDELPIFNNLSEESIGTNAAGISLITGESITVNGCEHYNKILTNYISTSIVVFSEISKKQLIVSVMTPNRYELSHRRLCEVLSTHFDKQSSNKCKKAKEEINEDKTVTVNSEANIPIVEFVDKTNICKEASNDNECKVFTLSVIEEKTIREALDYYKWNLKKSSQALGIGRSTLYRKLKEYRIKK